MKKILIVSVLLGSIILAGCSQKQLSQDELFQKKQECGSYKEAIKSEIKSGIEKENWKTLEQLWVSIYVKEVFYSSERNSCLYIYNNQNNWYSNYYLVDHLTKEYIMWYGETISSSEYISEFNKKVKELKWE